MKKYLFTLICLNTFYNFSISQTINEEEILRKEIDSLKSILPRLRDSARVDCLNTLAYKYYDLDTNWKSILGLEQPVAMQANTEAKLIGYRKGLGFSYLRLAEVENCKNAIYLKEHKQFDNAIFENQEGYLRSAIAAGELINDNIIIGNAYMQLCYVAHDKKDTIHVEGYIRKAISYLEKTASQPRTAYREYDYVDCPGCQGNEFWLGTLYRDLARRSIARNETPTARIYIDKAVAYLRKTTDKLGLGRAYYQLSFIAFRGYDHEAAVDASKKAISLLNETGNENEELQVYTELCKMYEIPGDFENGVEYCKKSILLAEKLARNKPAGRQNNFTWGAAFFWMCRLYKLAGDYETAMEIIRRGRNYYPQPMNDISKETWESEIGDLHRLMGNYDSALYYLEPFQSRQERHNFGKVALGYLYIDLKEYEKALQIVNPVIHYLKEIGRTMPPLANCLVIASHASFGKKNYPVALKYAREALAALRIMDGRVIMIKDYKLLSDIFLKLGNTDSSYFYLNQYTTLKDSLINRQFYWKLTHYKKEAEDASKESAISLLSKDNKIKNQQLKQQALVRNFLFAGLLALLLIGIFIYRNLALKRKNEKLRHDRVQSQLHQKASDLEMQALRAQMNPHFIFNCLSSINRFILKNETEIASDYLTKFSRLIRMVLIHSRSAEILLKDEIEMLRLYLDMEQLRFKNSFDYSIRFTNSIDPEIVFIPPLLFQPFCENAIWHGLMHKEGHGWLEIELSLQDDNLHCIITDNGIGRKKAAELKSRSGEMHKSVGLKITVERLALMNKENGLQSGFQAEDVLDAEGNVAGTKVILNIHCRDNTNEPVKETTK